MNNLFETRSQIPNTDDKLHCTQATMIMAAEIVVGRRLTMPEAEVYSGFRPGNETWPYSMIAWFAENGARVIHVDALDAVAFAANPLDELRRSGLGEETVQYFAKISDFDQESAAIQRAVASGRVQFKVEIPEVDELEAAMQVGWLPILSLDAATLWGADPSHFDGHVLLCTGCDGDVLRLQDPGPPPRWDWDVPRELVAQAMRRPADTSGTITYIR